MDYRAKITWNTKINVPEAIPTEVIEKLIILRDFMSDEKGNVTKKFATNEATIANRLCKAYKNGKNVLEGEFRCILDKYVYNIA